MKKLICSVCIGGLALATTALGAKHQGNEGSSVAPVHRGASDRKSTRLNSSHMSISYAVFCLKKNNLAFLEFVPINQLLVNQVGDCTMPYLVAVERVYRGSVSSFVLDLRVCFFGQLHHRNEY